MATAIAFPTAQFAREAECAVEAVRLASHLCREVQRDLGDTEKVSKDDSSPVTVADYGAQAVIAWVLARGLGGAPCIVGEEDSASLRSAEGQTMLLRITELVNKVVQTVDAAAQLSTDDILALIDLGSSEGGSVGQHWVLDPIDGTRGFVNMRQYAVCLGFLQDGKVVMGVLGCPNLPMAAVTDTDGQAGAELRSSNEGIGALFLAHTGHGAFSLPLWDPSVAPQRIRVPDTKDFSKVRFMESVEAAHSNHGISAALGAAVGVVLPSLKMDSQVKYGLLSRGDAAVFMRFPPEEYREKIWDHAAGVCIVEEAGGKVSDGTGQPLDFSKGRYLALNRGIIAAPPTLHAALVEALSHMPRAAAPAAAHH